MIVYGLIIPCLINIICKLTPFIEKYLVYLCLIKLKLFLIWEDTSDLFLQIIINSKNSANCGYIVRFWYLVDYAPGFFI